MSVDWRRFRKCPVCHADLGKQCRSLSWGITDGHAVDLGDVPRDRPHTTRRKRTGGAS